MNFRERLLTVFEHRKPDVVPWFADLSYLYDSLQKRNMLDSQYFGDKGYVRFYRDNNVGCFLFLDGVWKAEFTGSIEHICKTDGDLYTEEFVTPIGTLRSIRRYMHEAMCWAPVERFVKSVKDLEIVKYCCRHQEYTPFYKNYFNIDGLWGPQGIPFVFVNGSPLGTFMGRWSDPETTAFMMFDNQKELMDTLDVIDNSMDSLFDIVASSPAQIVELGENLSSEIIGGYFREHCLPWYQKRIKQMHDGGKYVSTHLDGTVGNLLPMLAESGINCVEAITTQPVGDINVDSIRSSAGNDMVIMGAMPAAMFAPPFSWNDIKKHLENVLSALKDTGPFILGSADAIPPDADISLISKIQEYLNQYGVYKEYEQHV